MKTLKKISLFALAAAFSLSLSSCESKEEDAMQPGSFKVKMTDSPANYDALDVEITNVSVYSEASGWVDLNAQSQFVNVLSLTNGSEAEIGYAANLEAGTYTKLKIEFGDENRLTLDGALELGGLSGLINVDLGYEGNHEVIIEIDEQVGGQSSGEVLLDFDVAASVIQQGNQYILNPAMHEIHDAQTGISGEVEGAASAFVTLSDGENSFSTYVDAQGRFLLRGMAAGSYDMIVEAANEAGQMQPDPITVQNVTVVSGEITTIGQVQF